MTIRNLVILPLLLAASSFCLLPRPCSGQESEHVKKPVTESISIRQDTQKEEQQWRDTREKLLTRLDTLEEKRQQLAERYDELQVNVQGTRERIAVKQNQLDDIEAIRGQITPLTGGLIDELHSFVKNDLPFLVEERNNRLERLIELRDDPEIPVSEKFRRVLEAMLVETEYGNTIEVYQELIDIEGKNTLVDIFRLGRVGLFFQTLDRKTCGFYDVATGSYQTLPAAHKQAIATAIEIGAKRRPVELLTLPLGRIDL